MMSNVSLMDNFIEFWLMARCSLFVKVFICQHFRAADAPPLPWPYGCGVPAYGPGGGGHDIPEGYAHMLNHNLYHSFLQCFGRKYLHHSGWTIGSMSEWDEAVFETLREYLLSV